MVYIPKLLVKFLKNKKRKKAMLEQFQTVSYSFDSYVELNDNLLYLDYINNNYKFKKESIDPATAYRYQGNLLGLFKEMGISDDLLFFTMYINGYNNPVDYKGDKLTFKVAIKPPIPVS